jgi:hypothetical protein
VRACVRGGGGGGGVRACVVAAVVKWQARPSSSVAASAPIAPPRLRTYVPSKLTSVQRLLAGIQTRVHAEVQDVVCHPLRTLVHLPRSSSSSSSSSSVCCAPAHAVGAAYLCARGHQTTPRTVVG